MPKNSRRKKDARRRVVAKGERYTRALRSTGTAASRPRPAVLVEATPEPEAWEQDLEQIRRRRLRPCWSPAGGWSGPTSAT